MPTPQGSSPFAAAAASVVPVDGGAAAAAAAHHDRLTKPRGALGRLEATGIQLSAISGLVPPPVPEPVTVAVFAGDHGVLAEGVSRWPAEVTAQMVANFCAGGAAISVLAGHAGADVVVVDVGVAASLDPAPGLILAKVRAGTRNLAAEPAMTRDEARRALDAGASVAATLVAAGAGCLVTGDMGIGNTTPSAALLAAFSGLPAAAVTGRGAGGDDDDLARKVEVVERALDRHGPVDPADPLGTLASLGGLEIAALAGFIVGGAAARVPVVVDGVVSCAALWSAERLVPDLLGWCFAGHRSTEPGASVALDRLGLVPLLDLGMRLGEGSGACLAVPVLQAAAKILREMATFDAAGVSDKDAAAGVSDKDA